MFRTRRRTVRILSVGHMSSRSFPKQTEMSALSLVLGVVLLASELSAQARFEVSAERALLRSKPSTEAAVLKTLGQGAEVLLLKDSSGWARVRFETTTGYVRRALLIESVSPVREIEKPQVAAPASRAPERAPDPEPRAVKLDPSRGLGSLAEAEALGTQAGKSKSVAAVYITSGVASATIPGLGFAGLLFLHTKGAEDLNPSFVQRSDLEGKSPEYVRRWAEGYDRAATAKQKRALILGSAVGSVVGIIIYKTVLFPSHSAY